MSDPIAAAQNLASALETLREELAESNAASTARLDEQTKYGRRNRAMIWALVIGFAVEVVLLVAMVQVSGRTTAASDKADRIRDRQISTCVSTNEARANNKKLWDYLLALPPLQERTDEQEKQLAKFREVVTATFAPRDCSKI